MKLSECQPPRKSLLLILIPFLLYLVLIVFEADTFQSSHNTPTEPATSDRAGKSDVDVFNIVIQDSIVSTEAEKELSPTPQQSAQKPTFEDLLSRMVFVVFRSIWKPELYTERLEAIRATWGKHARLLLVAPEGTPPIEGVEKAVPPPGANYGQQLLFALDLIAKEWPNVDWVVKGDDPTYWILENVVKFTSSLDPTTPYFLGHRLLLGGQGNFFFNSGGAGYIISKAALDKLSEVHTTCAGGHAGEDLAVAQCFQDLGIPAHESKDEFGRERFHAFQPGALVGAGEPQDYKPTVEWYVKYSRNDVRSGLECCSTASLSFHYVSPQEVYAIDYILHSPAPALTPSTWPGNLTYTYFVNPSQQLVRDLLTTHIKLGGDPLSFLPP